MVFGGLTVFFVVPVGFCVAIGVPIAFLFGSATMSYLFTVTDMPLSVVVNRMHIGALVLALIFVAAVPWLSVGFL